MEVNEEVIEQEEQETTPDPVVEKAKGMGWAPKEEWRGDPEKWRDAKEFVDRSENILPIVKERLDTAHKEIREMKETFREFNEFHKKTEERAYNAALREFEQRKIDAVASADVEGYQQAQREQHEFIQEQPPHKPAAPPANPEWDEFVVANDWYKADPDMRAFADSIGNYYISTGKMTKVDVLKAVEKDVRQRYPQKFQNQRREGADHVERSPDTGLPTKKGKTYNDLPAEAKTACDKFVGTIPGYTKEQYVKDYSWD